jgi:hypothetical protein
MMTALFSFSCQNKKILRIRFYYSCGKYIVPTQQGRFFPKHQLRWNEPVESNDRPCHCCQPSYDFCLVCGIAIRSTNVGLSTQTPRLSMKDYSSNQFCRILGTMDGVRYFIDTGKQKTRFHSTATCYGLKWYQASSMSLKGFPRCCWIDHNCHVLPTQANLGDGISRVGRR